MKITCTSPHMAIKSAQSTDFLKNILKEIDTEIDIDFTLTIFNKIKNLSPISPLEDEYMTKLIRSKKFDLIFTNLFQNLDFTLNSKKGLSKKGIIQYFEILKTKSRIIDILNKIWWEDFYNSDWITYLKLNNHWEKNSYLELIELYWDYWIFLDIKSQKYKLVNYKDKDVKIESKSELSFNHIDSCEEFVFINTDDYSKVEYVMIWENIVQFWKNSQILENKYWVYFIDYHTSSIIYYDKETSKIIHREFWDLEFVESFDNLLLQFSKPVYVWWKKSQSENSFSNGFNQLYDVFKNKVILSEIHVWAYYIDENYLIYLSSDCLNINYYNLSKNKLETKIFSEIEWYDENISEYSNFIKLIKKETI